MTTPKENRDRHAVAINPRYFAMLSAKTNPWYENEEEIEAGLAWGRRKARLLRWVRLQVGRRLTARERQCLEQHFFEGIALAEIAARTGTNASSVHRAIRRSVCKLREAARVARFRESPRAPSRKRKNREDDPSDG